MSDIIREPRLEATKFFNTLLSWNFEQLFKVFAKSLDQIHVLLVVPVCVRTFAQNYLEWLETCTGKAIVNECREYFFAKVTLQEKTELKDVFKDTVNVTAQAEAYRAYITAPAVPTKSSTSFSEDQLTQQTDGTYTGDESDRGTDEDVQERHSDKVDEELIESSTEKKRKDEDDVTSTPPTKKSRSRYESPYSPSLPSLTTDLHLQHEQTQQAHTPERHIITPEDEEEKENSLYDTFPVHIHKRPEPNPFLVGNQNDHNIDEEGDEFNADLTIIFFSLLNIAINNTETIDSFEKRFTLHFVSHMVKVMEDVNLFHDPMSEGTYIVKVLASILDYFFDKKKKDWRVSYGETCLKACAKDVNSSKKDDERRSSGKKIDTIICMREEDKEFSVTEVSGSPLKNDWTHFMGDQNELTIYEFKLKYTEVYTTEAILTFPLPKTWADMMNADKAIMGLLKYEHLLSESSKTIRDFLWAGDGMIEAIKMTTRIIHTPESTKKAKNIKSTKKMKKKN
ncbi:hypothetical protein Glove_62g12 [Diversispora epigaea]|uniref:Uncharacterized protein n=1 Tax=Diversispora epigaea TaxID=1348612 RepID=A0A397JBJ5_9GLOM|nr:hypothetical protein Glove_62g12 [Diversispora epigaea]